MADLNLHSLHNGRGEQIKMPSFFSQAEMDLVLNEFLAQDGDVFVTTYPRSGTTWTEQIVHLLVNKGEQGDKRITDAVPWLETLGHRPNGMIEFLKTMQAPRLFTSHLPYSFMPSLENTTAKVVYVARNPKDVVISSFFHFQSKLSYEGTWEEFFLLFLNDDVGFGRYFDHILSWWHASQNNPNILYLKYEDMKRDHAGNVAKIAAFLGIEADAELIETVVNLSSFKNMTADTKTNFDWVPQRAGVPKHFRKGEIGDWHNHFTAEQSQQIDEQYAEKMKDTGLDFDFGDN